MVATTASSPRSFRLFGRSLMAYVLTPEPPVSWWLDEVETCMGGAADFFAGRPVVLDLSRLSPSKPVLEDLLTDLQARGVRIISVEGVDPSWLDASLAPLPSGSQSTGVMQAIEHQPTDNQSQASEPPPQTTSLLVDNPVRSGQCVDFPAGDITVVGSLASGAEVIAGGSIHVYGALRGRAIAGSNGNATARIFCHKFEAELLGIGGLCATADDIGSQLRGQPVQAWLDSGSIKLAALDRENARR